MGLLNPLETRISLEMSGDTKLYMLSAKQGDKATRYVVAELSNNGERYFIPPGAYAVVNVKKPDGKTVYNDCVYSESEVTFELTNQMISAAGTAYCDIEIRTKDEAEIIKTQTFTIEIEKMMRNDSAILSSNEYTFFEKSMIKVKEITESLNNAKIDYVKAEERENISTEDTFAIILGKLEKIISEIKEVAYSGKYDDLTGIPEEMYGATEEEAGAAGIVPAPAAGKQDAFLRGNGEWTELGEMYGATGEAAGAAGIVPAPAAGKQDAFLRGNGEWTELGEMSGATGEAAGAAGIVPAPAAGKQDAFLRGNGEWTELGEMSGATGEAAGAAGIVPAPAAGKQDAFLRGNGEWTELGEMSGATEEAAGAAGIVPVPEAGKQDAFLRGDATWGNLGAGAFAESADNLTTTQEGFYLEARQGKELADQISLLNSAMESIDSKILKFVDYKLENLSNTNTGRMYLSLPGHAGINILFVTIVDFSDLKGGITSVGGAGSHIWLFLEPGASLNHIILRIWYV